MSEHEDVAYEVALQRVLLDLFQLPVEGRDLPELLAHCLDVLLAAPFLALLPRGGIFLADGPAGALRLAASRGLPPALVVGSPRVAASHHAVPLRSGDEALGLLVLFPSVGRRLRPVDDRLLASAGVILAGLIQRKRAEQVLVDHASALRRGVEARTAELTEALRREESLRAQAERACDQALRSNQAMEEFVLTLSHELRAPLTGLVGFTELLEARVSADPSLVRLVDRLQESNARLVELVDDCLDYGLVRSGKLHLVDQGFRPADLLDEVVRIAAQHAGGRPIEVFTTGAAGAAQARGDVRRLRQVLVNLAINAVKFTERGSVVVAFDARPLADGRLSTRWSVIDTGRGMKEDEVERLFEPFERAEGERPGYGLGLGIARRLVRAMGGDIRVRSVPGQGSTFSFEVELPHGDLELPVVAARSAAGSSRP